MGPLAPYSLRSTRSGTLGYSRYTLRIFQVHFLECCPLVFLTCVGKKEKQNYLLLMVMKSNSVAIAKAKQELKQFKYLPMRKRRNKVEATKRLKHRPHRGELSPYASTRIAHPRIQYSPPQCKCNEEQRWKVVFGVLHLAIPSASQPSLPPSSNFQDPPPIDCRQIFLSSASSQRNDKET